MHVRRWPALQPVYQYDRPQGLKDGSSDIFLKPREYRRFSLGQPPAKRINLSSLSAAAARANYSCYVVDEPELAGAPPPDTAVLEDKYLSGTVCASLQAAPDIEPEMAGAPLPDSASTKGQILRDLHT